MLRKKTEKYLLAHCRPLNGTTVVVTGANSGIGFKATEELLFLGAKVIMACRNIEKAVSAKNLLLSDFPGADVEIRELNLASRTSIQTFADGLLSDSVDVHAFVNNAGVFRIHGTTEDGEDIVMGTNFTGTVLLAEKLMPYFGTLPHKVKMSFTTSISYRIGSNNPPEDFSGMSDLKIYATSKLLLTRYAMRMADRLSADRSNVSVVLTHPGISITALVGKAFGKAFMKIAAPVGKMIFQTPEKSALAVPLVVSTETESSAIYGPGGFLNSWGYPMKNRIRNIEKF